ncbi:GrpB family protein [Rubrivivax rivuli]|uniref:GrpB family protein n=1 Tax=Rubrivivax rivuli TaxID=1862385 RepID=A0A437RAH6_9BURK|nr:GrpB family protein [Rubrivivax rivuli]RVU43781.1 GrpB family protein [Rubrivivax rivuli]
MAALQIVEHRAAWAGEFEALRQRLQAALGPLALRIDHIGSTAVPGLCAKDVIDVQVTVATLDGEAGAAVATGLQAAGFVLHAGATADHVPPGAEAHPAAWRKQLFKNPPELRRAHIHVRVRGAANQRYALLCRDFLRAHPPTAQAYGELKRRLAAALADPAAYPEVKDPAVDLVVLAAEAWAAQRGWSGAG